MLEFTKGFKCEIITETMLVDSINDREEEIESVAEFLARLKTIMAYVAIPTRPPAEKWVKKSKRAGHQHGLPNIQ